MIGGDGLTRGAQATLAAQLPAALATLNAEPDAVQLAVPSRYTASGKHWPMPDLPVEGVIVKVGCPNTDGDDLDLATAQADTVAAVQVTVWAHLPPTGDRDMDGDLLSTALHRYAKAVVAVMAHDDTCCEGSTIHKFSTAVRAADVDPDSGEQPLVQGAAAVILLVHYVETLAV